MYSTRYLAFDMGLGRQIFVKDIALDSAKLRRLAHADYLRQKRQQGIDPLVQYAEFELGDNFYFDKKGIYFVYASKRAFIMQVANRIALVYPKKMC